MVLISFTNIIVDDFSIGKQYPMKKYIYFLTHMHSDHYQGITPSWNYGTIYCSKITKQLLLLKFPQLPDVRELPMNVPYKLCIHQGNNIDILVYLFDANHCPGSVMYLFEGYFGRILHTGDMRFNQDLIDSNPILFPISKKPLQNSQCSIQIDECIFDNTFCDKIFNFCDKPSTQKIITDIISKHIKTDNTNDENNLRVLLCIDSIGKEDLLVYLSKTFYSLIVVNQQKYQELVHMNDPDNIPLSMFSTNRADGWIEVIRKNEKYQRLYPKQNYQNNNNERCIAITCSGWANIKEYVTYDNRDYLVAYSSHSNNKELELFAKSIRPGILNTVVRKPKSSQKMHEIGSLSKYLVSLHKVSQRGVEELQKNYTDLAKLSSDYKCLMSDLANQRKINLVLGLEVTEEQRGIEDMVYFQQKYQNKVKRRSSGRANKEGAKLIVPDENKLFNRDAIMEIQQKLEKVKEEIKGKKMQNREEQEEGEERQNERIQEETVQEDNMKGLQDIEQMKDNQEKIEDTKEPCDYDEIDADDEEEVLKRITQIKEFLFAKQSHPPIQGKSEDQKEREEPENTGLDAISSITQDNSYSNRQQGIQGYSRRVQIRIFPREQPLHKGQAKFQEDKYNNKENLDEANNFKDQRDNNNEQTRVFWSFLKELKQDNQLGEEGNRRICVGQDGNQHNLLQKRKYESSDNYEDSDDNSESKEEMIKRCKKLNDQFISEEIERQGGEEEDCRHEQSSPNSQSSFNKLEYIKAEDDISPGQKDWRNQSSSNSNSIADLFEDIEDANKEDQEITENEDISHSFEDNNQQVSNEYQQNNDISCEMSMKDDGQSSIEDIEESFNEAASQPNQQEQDDLEGYLGNGTNEQHNNERLQIDINAQHIEKSNQSESSSTSSVSVSRTFQQVQPQKDKSIQQDNSDSSENQEILRITHEQDNSQQCDSQLDSLTSEESLNQPPKIILNKSIPVFKNAAMNALFQKYLSKPPSDQQDQQ